MAEYDPHTGEVLDGGRKPCPPEIIKARIAIMKAVKGVGKTGHNKFHNYDYASDFDVLMAVRSAMVENELALEMWPEHVSEDQYGNMWVKFAMQWQHGSGVVADPIPWYGVAMDRDKSGRNGDKWFNKAATAAEKYFFLKQFHIPAGKDMDPDAVEADPPPARQQRQASPAPAKPQNDGPPVPDKPGRIPTPTDPKSRELWAGWAKALLAAVRSSKTLDECSEWLMHNGAALAEYGKINEQAMNAINTKIAQHRKTLEDAPQEAPKEAAE